MLISKLEYNWSTKYIYLCLLSENYRVIIKILHPYRKAPTGLIYKHLKVYI
jgi:hypothetical protein